MCPGNLEPLSFTPFDVSVCSLGLKLTAASITYNLLEITLNIQQKVNAKAPQMVNGRRYILNYIVLRDGSITTTVLYLITYEDKYLDLNPTTKLCIPEPRHILLPLIHYCA